MYTLRAHLLISAGLFAALIGTALAGHAMQRARPGMTLEDLVRQSTLQIDLTHANAAIAGGNEGPFEFAIPGTGISFPRARYYFMTTSPADSTRLEAINVGVPPEKLSRVAIDSADAALAARLSAGGWLAGREIYRDEEDRQLHGGATEGPEGRHWLRDGMVLTISRKRTDDEISGEDPATAGEWIQYVDLWPAPSYPGFERFAFQAPR